MYLASSYFFLLLKIAIFHNSLAMVGSLGGVMKVLPRPAEYSGMHVLLCGDLMAFFNTCFRTVVCMLQLGPSKSYTFLDVVSTL